MDIQMPVMDGYAATKRIRKWESERRNAEVGMRNAEVATQNGEGGLKAQSSKPKVEEIEDKDQNTNSAFRIPHSEFKKIPIIAMTAHAMAGDEQKSLDAGMNDHVTKPINPDLLFAALQKWIKPGGKQIQEQPPPISTQEPKADPTFPHDEVLPESLPEFDLATGLKRLMGNKKLYRKLLVDFGTK
jgi:CheY-like chemotaxis protein